MKTEKSIGSIKPSSTMLKNKYRIDRTAKLGSGSYGTVFNGCFHEAILNEYIDIAVKEVPLTCSPQDFSTFRMSLQSQLNAYQKMQGLKHVVQLYDCVRQDNSLFLVMERCDDSFYSFWPGYLDKTTLAVRFFFMQMLNGYNCLHSRGILHHDIKPQNFLIKNESIVKICDFGLAEPKQQQKYLLKSQNRNYLTSSPQVRFGLPIDPSAAPECSDVWSLGITLFWMLTLSFVHNEHSIIHEYQDIKMQNIPEEFRQVLSRMLDINTAKRIKFGDLLEYPLFQLETILAQNFEIPLGYTEHQQLMLDLICSDIELQLVPTTYSQIMIPTDVYLCRQMESYHDIRRHLKYMLDLHQIKQEYLEFLHKNIAAYGINRIRLYKQHKKCTLLGIRRLILLEYRHIVTLQFLDAAERQAFVRDSTSRHLLSQLARIYNTKKEEDQLEWNDMLARYPDTARLARIVMLKDYYVQFKRQVGRFLSLLNQNKRYLEHEELSLAHYLILLHCMDEAQMDQQKCNEMRRFMARQSKMQIPCTSIMIILDSFK